MSLKISKSGHWQLPEGFELRSGDQVEVFLDGCWIPGEVNYRPRGPYQIWFKNGQIIDISESLTLRILNREWLKKSRKTEKPHA